MRELDEDGVHVHIGSARTTGYRPNAVPASIRLCRCSEPLDRPFLSFPSATTSSSR